MPDHRQPWPMKWIVVAILLLIVPYTFITLRYRKSAPAFQPYEDLKNRANVSRLLEAGYQRIPIVAERPAETGRALGGATIETISGGIPADLRSTLVEAPALATDIGQVIAGPSVASLLPYVVQLTCTLPDEKQELAGADLYLRGDQLVIAPKFQRVAADLHTRSPRTSVLLTIPSGVLKPGRYTITLIAERSSRTWPLVVR